MYQPKDLTFMFLFLLVPAICNWKGPLTLRSFYHYAAFHAWC